MVKEMWVEQMGVELGVGEVGVNFCVKRTDFGGFLLPLFPKFVRDLSGCSCLYIFCRHSPGSVNTGDM